jgi:tetratricopeptide (TPR) repeat protein
MAKKKSRQNKKSHNDNINTPSSPDSQLDIKDPGILSRPWSPKEERANTLTRLGAVSERSSYQNYLYGKYLVINGVLEDDNSQLDQGFTALFHSADSEDSTGLAEAELTWLGCFFKDNADIKYAEKALIKFPENNELWRFTGLQYLGLGQAEKARSYLTKSLDLLQSHPDWATKLDSLNPKNIFLEGAGFVLPEPNFGSLENPQDPDEHIFFNYSILCKCCSLEPKNTQIIFEAALHAYFINNLVSAKTHLELLVSLKEDNADYWAMYGFILEKLKDDETSMSYCRHALELNPNHPFANTNMARRYLERGDVKLSRQLLEVALRAAPDYPEALSYYGRILAFEEDQENKSITYHQKAIQMDPENSEYHLHYCLSLLQVANLNKLQGEWNYHKKYIQAYTKHGGARQLISIVLTGAKDPLQEVAIAEILNKNGFKRAAAIFIQRAWKKWYKVDAAKQMEFLYHAGIQASQAGENEIAYEAYKKLEEKEGKGTLATIYSAIALNRLGRNQEALESILSCDQTDSRVLMIKGNIEWSNKQRDEALLSYLDSLNQSSPPFLSAQNGIRYAISERQMTILAQIRQKAEALWPDSIRMSALAGEAHIVAGEYKEAINKLEGRLMESGSLKLVTLTEQEHQESSENSVYEPYYMLGWAYLKSGNTSKLTNLLSWLFTNLPEAVQEWEVLKAEMLRNDGKNPEALDCIKNSGLYPPARLSAAFCHLAMGAMDIAESHARGLLSDASTRRIYLHPQGNVIANAHAVLAEILRVNQDVDEARLNIEKALELQPDNEFARSVMDKISRGT